MAKKAVSWLLVGVFAYLWWWFGHGWSYLNTAGNEWSRVFVLLTLISLVVLLRAPRPAGGEMFGRVTAAIRGFAPTLPWLVLAVVVLRAIGWAHSGLDDPVDHFTHAIVAALVAGVTTALWFGAVDNASD